VSQAFGLVERLDFTLPDFARLSWVSEPAQQVWGPRLGRIARAWSDVEWLSVDAGVRHCCLTRLPVQGLLSQVSRWARRGLTAAPLRLEGSARHGYASTPTNPRPDRPSLVCTVVGRAPSVDEFRRAWDAGDHETIGALLGYPPCCRAFFRRVWAEAGCVDTTWAMAANTVGPSGASGERAIEVGGPPEANILWRWMGVRAVPHLPCRFDCAPTVALAEQMREVGKGAGYEAEMAWSREILAWPAEWSALHGIAEVKTPVLKVSTRTDATARRYVVRRAGGAFPEEAPAGLRFPFRPGTRPTISGSLGFRRGLDHPLQTVPPRPEWRHRDNGFFSRHGMDVLHRPIVNVASKAVAGLAGNVLDLGCGNGALLEKICRDRDRLTPYGIDLNDEALNHARELLPWSAQNFVRGDFFDLAAWPDPLRYCLAILMVGRLFEVPVESAGRLLTAVRARCDRVLVYAYPGSSPDPLEELVHRAGLRLGEMRSDYAGLIAWDEHQHSEPAPDSPGATPPEAQPSGTPIEPGTCGEPSGP
jgi:SAM-dependent methyltransferase